MVVYVFADFVQCISSVIMCFKRYDKHSYTRDYYCCLFKQDLEHFIIANMKAADNEA